MRTYYVNKGENFRQIAENCRRSAEEIARLNGRDMDDELMDGEVILLPPHPHCKEASTIREGALCLNGFLGDGLSRTTLKEALPYLASITIEGGSYSTKTGLVLPHMPHKDVLENCSAIKLLLPRIDRNPLAPLGEYCGTLLANGYGGLVLSVSDYSTEELTSALPQLAKIYKNNELGLYILIRESALRKRTKLWIYLSEILDGILLLADEIATPWQVRLAHLGEDFPKEMYRRVYAELPYALLQLEDDRERYFPLQKLSEQIQRCHAKRGCGSHQWIGEKCVIFGEDASSVSAGLSRLAQLSIPGVSLHLGHTPAWILSLIRSRFACQVRCQRNDKHSPW